MKKKGTDHVHAAACVLAALACGIPAQGHTAIAKALVDPQHAESLAARCDKLEPKQEIDPDKVAGFVRALNEPLFEKYDLDCNGKIEGAELERYHAEARAKAQKALDQAIESVEERTADTISSIQSPLSYEAAYRIPPDAEIKSAGMKVSFTDLRKPTTDSETYSFELSAEQKPWRVFRGPLPITVGLDWSLGADRQIETDSTSRTQEDEVTFTPFSFKTTDPDERFTFKFSLGAAYVWSEETVRASGERTREESPTFAYATELSYALDQKKCWSIGLKYEYKTRHAFSDTVSASLKPELGFKFVCTQD
jgi:hypothetical protein